MSDQGRDLGGRFGQGNPYRFSVGQTGNPCGRPKGASFSAALSRQALKPVADREEMSKIAKSIGLADLRSRPPRELPMPPAPADLETVSGKIASCDHKNSHDLRRGYL